MSRIDSRAILPLVEIPSARSPARSPVRDAIVFIGDDSGIPQLWIMDGAEIRRLTDHPEPVDSFAWSPTGNEILFAADYGGDERWQFHLLKLQNGEVRALTADPMTVHMWGAFSPDGMRIAYSANDRQKDQLDLRVMDLATGVANPVGKASGHQEVLAFSPDGGSLLVRRTLGAASDQKLVRVDIATGDTGPILDADRPVKFIAARMLKSGGGLAICDFEGDRMALWRFGESGECMGSVYHASDCDLDAFALEPDQKNAIVSINQNGFSRLERVDLLSGEGHRLVQPLEGVVTGLTAPTGDIALCAISGPCIPSGIWELPLSGEPVVKRHGADSLPQGRQPELCTFESFDGLHVPYFLYPPEGEAPPSGWPAVFIIHGGPEMQWRPEWRADVQWLVRQGIMVVAPNVRGSTGYGRHYHGLDDREKRLDSLADLTALRAHLVAGGTVDEERTCIFGRSYGGYMVMAALTETPELWRCGINFYGIGNFATHLMATGPWARLIRVAEYGDPERDADLLARISPVNQIERVRGPLLMVHADRDPRVPPCESEIINSLMFGLGKRCDFLRIAHEGHGFKRIDNIRRVFGTMAEFIAQEL